MDKYKYTFVSRFEYIKGNESMVATQARIFVLEDGYICKRINSVRFQPNEYLLPNKINKRIDKKSTDPDDKNRIIRFVDYFERKSTFFKEKYIYLVSKYNDEKDLHSYIEHLKIKEELLIEIILEMARCIRLCHEAKVIHMDIKTENFVVIQEKPLRLKLIDFGFSRYGETKKLKNVCGTKLFIAPEIIRKECYFKSDVFSLGSVAMFLQLDNFNDIPKENLSIEVQGLRRCRPALKEIIRNMVEFEVDRRYDIHTVIKKLLHL